MLLGLIHCHELCAQQLCSVSGFNNTLIPIRCRFWQRKLTTDCPFWVNNGIVPELGRPAGQRWQELAIMAAQFQLAEEQNRLLQPPLTDEARIAQLWAAAAGKCASAC